MLANHLYQGLLQGIMHLDHTKRRSEFGIKRKTVTRIGEILIRKSEMNGTQIKSNLQICLLANGFDVRRLNWLLKVNMKTTRQYIYIFNG